MICSEIPDSVFVVNSRCGLPFYVFLVGLPRASVAIADGRIAPDASPGLQRAAIAEELGWREAVSNGGIGIQGPGKVTTGGPDYITYDPEVDTITLWDATSGKTPKQVPVPEYWMPEARAAVRSYTGPHAAEIQQALANGQVDVTIFRYIPQGY